MLRPSPNHGTLRLPNDDDDHDIIIILEWPIQFNSIQFKSIYSSTETHTRNNNHERHLPSSAVKRSVSVRRDYSSVTKDDEGRSRGRSEANFNCIATPTNRLPAIPYNTFSKFAVCLCSNCFINPRN